MATKEQLKAAIHTAFDTAVPNGSAYTKVYAYDMRQKNFVIYRSTTVRNYAVGFIPGRTELVILPISEDRGAVSAGEPVHITDANRGAVKRRDLQGRFQIATADGTGFRLTVIPAIPKIAAGFYGLPVDQVAETEEFQAVRDLICGS